MEQIINDKLDILENAGEISKSIKLAVQDFAKNFEEKYEIELTEGNGSMLIIHLAMALARIQKGEPVNPIDQTALEEIKGAKAYNDFPSFFRRIEEKLGISIPESEKDYITLHGCTIVEGL